MDLNLRGRTALITGASKGIGLASAESLAAEGVNLILVSRTQADLDAARARIAGRHNVNVQAHAHDLADSRNVDALAAAHPDIDILVNNAGAIPGGDLQAIDEQRWRQAWDLKVFGYINMCRRFYAAMKARGRGVIVNVLGMAGEKMDRGYIAGSTGNAGLMAFTRALGGSAGDDGLRVVGINPGAIATDRLVTLMKQRAEVRFGDASPLGGTDETPADGPGGNAAGDRGYGGVPGVGLVGLHDGDDRYHRRGRGQSRTDVLNEPQPLQGPPPADAHTLQFSFPVDELMFQRAQDVQCHQAVQRVGQPAMQCEQLAMHGLFRSGIQVRQRADPKPRDQPEYP